MGIQIQINGQKTIPTLWRERILKRDYEVILGKMLQSGQSSEEETEEFYLRSANVQWEGVDMSDVKTMWFSPAEKRHLLLSKGDLLVNEGGDVGRCAIWCGDLESCYFQNAINRVRAKTSSSTKFLYYWLYNLKHAGFIDAMVSRITIAHLTAEKLERVPCPDVPAAEQQRIAAYLDASCAAIDAAVAAKRLQLETLDALRKTTIHNATTQGINPHAKNKQIRSEMFDSIPEHWKVDRFKDVVLLRNKKSDQSSESEDYLELEDMESGTGQILNRRNTMEVGSAVTLFEKGDILFGKLRPYLEKYYEAEFDGKCTGEILAFKPTRVRGRFLFYCIASPWFITRCNILAYGTKMPRINWPTQLAQFDLPLPSIEEQDVICEFLDSKLAEIKSIRRGIEAQITTLTAYRKSLIHECVIGQRRITEADVAQAHKGREVSRLQNVTD